MRIALLSFLFLATGAFAQDESVDVSSGPVNDAAPEPTLEPTADSALESAGETESEAALAPAPGTEGGVMAMSGMSILGNEEAPKSLVIVPWKSSRLGDGLGISNALDETPRAVDKEVFMRELHFYGLRSGTAD